MTEGNTLNSYLRDFYDCTLGASKGYKCIGGARVIDFVSHKVSSPEIESENTRACEGKVSKLYRVQTGNLDMDWESAGTNAMDAAGLRKVFNQQPEKYAQSIENCHACIDPLTYMKYSCLLRPHRSLLP